MTNRGRPNQKNSRRTKERKPVKTGGKLPPMPRDLNAAEKTAWKAICGFSGPDGSNLIGEQDGTLLRQTVFWISNLLEARKDIIKNGVVYETITDKGSESKRRNPAISVAKDAATILNSCLAQLGLTPASRLKFGVTGDEENELSKLLKKAGLN